RIKDLKAPRAAFMRLTEPIRFDASDGRMAQMLFILLVPETATQLHLDLLAEIARLMADDTLRHRLVSETDAHTVHQLLTAPSRQPSSRIHAYHPRTRTRQ